MSRKDFHVYKQLKIPEKHKEEIIDLVEGFRGINSFLGPHKLKRDLIVIFSDLSHKLQLRKRRDDTGNIHYLYNTNTIYSYQYYTRIFKSWIRYTIIRTSKTIQ